MRAPFFTEQISQKNLFLLLKGPVKTWSFIAVAVPPLLGSHHLRYDLFNHDRNLTWIESRLTNKKKKNSDSNKSATQTLPKLQIQTLVYIHHCETDLIPFCTCDLWHPPSCSVSGLKPEPSPWSPLLSQSSQYYTCKHELYSEPSGSYYRIFLYHHLQALSLMRC